MLDPERAEYEFYIYDRFVGIEDKYTSNYNVFPNPANSVLTIETDSFKQFKYELLSTLGGIILSGVITSNNHRIQVDDVTPGVYFLKLENRTVKVVITD